MHWVGRFLLGWVVALSMIPECFGGLSKSEGEVLHHCACSCCPGCGASPLRRGHGNYLGKRDLLCYRIEPGHGGL